MIRKFIALSTKAPESPTLPLLFYFFVSLLSKPPRNAYYLSHKLTQTSVYHQDKKWLYIAPLTAAFTFLQNGNQAKNLHLSSDQIFAMMCYLHPLARSSTVAFFVPLSPPLSPSAFFA